MCLRGLLARSVLQAQAASPIFTHVYAAVVAIINSKFPQIGELILKRLILTFRRSYRRNLKVSVISAESCIIDGQDAVCGSHLKGYFAKNVPKAHLSELFDWLELLIWIKLKKY